jgi:hypothetical protein
MRLGLFIWASDSSEQRLRVAGREGISNRLANRAPDRLGESKKCLRCGRHACGRCASRDLPGYIHCQISHVTDLQDFVLSSKTT